MIKACSILLADDHPVFRKGLYDIISEYSNHKIIGEAEDGKKAVEMVSNLQPDIIILDINMPSLSGFEVVKEILKLKLKTRVIFLTMHKEEEILHKALDYNAKGYILKECAVDDIIECINYVAEDKIYVSPAISGLLLKRNKEQRNLSALLATLTSSELKVLKLISEEKTSRDIADELFISIRTVEAHRSNICNKLNIHGINSLLKFALENKHLI